MARLLILGFLSVIASLSPLLTLAWLWQVKEWRLDRLQEHLRSAGWLSQLLGKIRPLILIAWLCGLALIDFITLGTHDLRLAWSLLIAAVLAGFSLAQLARRSQRLPHWTHKAVAITAGAVILDGLAIIAMTLTPPLATLTPIIIVLQPLSLLLSWTFFFPIDRHLKARVMNAARIRRASHPDLTVIGITGSVGKTTTKELLAHLLADRTPLVTPEHVNTEMGVSQWLNARLQTPSPSPTPTLIVEMGAYRKGEIALLCSIVQPTMGIITAIGEQHLALFGSRQNIIDGKGELFDALPENGHAFINADNDAWRELAAKCRCKTTSIGTDSGVDLRATDIQETSQGMRFTLEGIVFDVPVHGTHNVTNVLLAMACAQRLGNSLLSMQRMLQTFHPPKRTFQVSEQDNTTILDDTHNASPQSFAAAIDWARTQPIDRRVLITSGIIELGEAEQKIHEKLALDAARVFSTVYLTDDGFLPYFQPAFGQRVRVLDRHSSTSNPALPSSAVSSNKPLTMTDGAIRHERLLLAFVGRMPPSVIQKFSQAIHQE